MDTNYENFCAGAILSKREACCAVHEMLRRCEENDLDVSLSEVGRKALTNVLRHFFLLLQGIGLPKLPTRYSTYAIDLFADCVQLGMVTYPDNTKFDSSGFPCYEEVAEGEEDTEDDGYAYKRLLCLPVPTVSLKVWAEQNGVNRNTARSWVAQGRLKTFDEGGNETRVSAIQYVPDAPYANKQIPVRFKLPRTLPEKIVKKYPCMDGDVFDICISPAGEGTYRLLVISKPVASNILGTQFLTIREDERDAIIRALLSVKGLKSTLDSRYRSPVGDFISGAPYRYARIKLTSEDVAKTKGLRITCTCTNDVGVNSNCSMPEYNVSAYDKEGKTFLCFITGNIFTSNFEPEQKLLMAFFSDTRVIEYRNRVLTAIGGPKVAEASWNRNILFLSDFTLSPDFDPDTGVSLVRRLPFFIERGLAFSTNLMIATVPVDEPDVDAKAEFLQKCGFAEVHEGEEAYTDCRVFYTYATK